MILERVAPAPAAATPAAAGTDEAVRRARGYIERSRTTGDPRWLGYAEGVLQAWSSAPAPPIEVRLLRATLQQSRHRFDHALVELDAVLAAEPRHPQALLTRATVLRVQGRFAEAAAACSLLVGHTDDFVATLCEVAVKGQRGALADALRDLTALAPFAATRSPELQDWYAAEFGEALLRAGLVPAAEKIYAQALSRGDDLHLRGAFADLLLAANRPVAAAALVGGYSHVDALALRLLLAQKALGTVDARLQARVADSYAAARRRGELPHLREEALYSLHLLGDTGRALELAERNWAGQREPADTALLAEAARAAGNSQVLARLRRWQTETGYEDVRLAPLRRAP